MSENSSDKRQCLSDEESEDISGGRFRFFNLWNFFGSKARADGLVHNSDDRPTADGLVFDSSCTPTLDGLVATPGQKGTGMTSGKTISGFSDSDIKHT